MKSMPNSPLWRVSLVFTALIVLMLLAVEIIFGFDWFTALVLILSVIALLGVWQGSSAGKAFLILLLIFEIVLLVPAIIGTFGLSALSGQGFSAPLRLLLILLTALVLTAIPLGTYMTYLNKLQQEKKNQTLNQSSQGKD